MKRHIIPMTMGLFTVVIILLPGSVFGQSTSGVTGAGAGAFPGSTTFSGVSVSGLQFGMGVFTPGDTTATGQFELLVHPPWVNRKISRSRAMPPAAPSTRMEVEPSRERQPWTWAMAARL